MCLGPHELLLRPRGFLATATALSTLATALALSTLATALALSTLTTALALSTRAHALGFELARQQQQLGPRTSGDRVGWGDQRPSPRATCVQLDLLAVSGRVRARSPESWGILGWLG